MPYEHIPPPAPPAERDWRFLQVLAETPYHQPLRWRRRRARAGEAWLGGGVRLDPAFPDPKGLLGTAFTDFDRFLACARLRPDRGFPIRLRHRPAATGEEFRLVVSADGAMLEAGGTEGVRRGLFWIEDEMQRRDGPFLPLGRTVRRPWMRIRISRSFAGPVNRPPRSREELASDEDHYPEAYLNRLSHEGVNGLWLTINWFRDIPSALIPEYGREAAPRLERLRRTVAKCARHGIRVYPFCIEPAGFTGVQPELAAAAAAHPELVGHRGAFCTGSGLGRAYVEEAVRTLFSAVPGLGGLIVIPVGERLTHCCSAGLEAAECPRCRGRDPVEVLGDTLAAMRRGLDAAAPGAELISWPYGQFVAWDRASTVRSAGRVPGGVALMQNFETGGANRQLGRRRPMWDYWHSVDGPTPLFRACAAAARARGTRTFAKLQVSCGHEVATTQYVPVPGIVAAKSAAMRRIGVDGAMLCWIPGGYPCVMTRAFGEAAFAARGAGGPGFLLGLARRDWGADAARVVRAWRLCEAAYRSYPTSHLFQYFGPMHAGVAWPLHLVPRRRQLAPTWQACYPPSGDYIAACLPRHFTLREITTLCGQLARGWARGAAILRRLLPRHGRHPDRRRDIVVAHALAIQFASGWRILRFYELRERLADARTPGARRALLRRLRGIVEEELRAGAELLPLLESEPLLGFHSEAEGYLYWPELVRWRLGQLRGLLAEEFPEVEARAGRPLFPAYTGEVPDGPLALAPRLPPPAAGDGGADGPDWQAIAAQPCAAGLHETFDRGRWLACGYDGSRFTPAGNGLRTAWKARHDGRRLHLAILSEVGGTAGAEPFAGSEVQVLIEAERTKPRIIFFIFPGRAVGVVDDGIIDRAWQGPGPSCPWRVEQRIDGGRWSAVLSVPLRWLRPGARDLLAPLRLNVVRKAPAAPAPGSLLASWTPLSPVMGRLVWGPHNPAADLGWLRLG